MEIIQVGDTMWKLYFVILMVMAFAMPPRTIFADSRLFTKVQKSLALIKTANGVGSGFLVEMDGRKYLITNDHVLRGGQPFSAYLISGTVIKTEGIEVANTRDLVRLPISENQQISTLVPSTKDLGIGDSISVFGNSDGAAVVTSIYGKIIGVGPEVIETDAKFIRGNSGSPIILADGSVVAIATYATLNPKPADWIKQNTRFSEVRRFGVRLTGVKWIPMTEKDYFVRINHLADLETFCHDIYALYYTSMYYNKSTKKHCYNSSKEVYRYRVCKDFSHFLDDLINGVHSVLQRSAFKATANARIKGGFNSPKIRRYQHRTGQSEYDRAMNKVTADLNNYIAKKGRKLLPRLNKLVHENDWKSERMKTEAESWLYIFHVLAVPE